MILLIELLVRLFFVDLIIADTVAVTKTNRFRFVFTRTYFLCKKYNLSTLDVEGFINGQEKIEARTFGSTRFLDTVQSELICTFSAFRIP